MYACVLCVPNTGRGQKRVLDLLGGSYRQL